MDKQWTILEALDWTQQRFEREGEENPRLAAQMLLAHATGLTRIDLYAQFDKPLSEGERSVLRESIQRRLKGEPLQYIRGSVGFRHLELKVRPPVLIPRPETEMLVELVLEYAKGSDTAQLRILDIGTGTGAIALSLLYELPGCHLTATDIDESAVELARENALELSPGGEAHLCVICDDLASTLCNDETCRGSFDIVVSNPPYIPTEEYEALPAEILQFESRQALDGGADGLFTFRRIVEQTQILLKPGGLLAVELHETTLAQAADCAAQYGYQNVQIANDLTGRQRFLMAYKE